MCDETVYQKAELLIKNAALFDCNTVCMFAGGDPTKSVPDNMPLFKKTFEPLAKLAEEYNVKIGFENCGEGWHRGTHNIGFCPSAWELMFNEVPSDALGLEWTAQVTALEYLKSCRGGIEFYDGPIEYRGYQGTRKKK